jgi:hypothetical protein
VFTLNCVVQDIEIITWPLRDATTVRAKMYFHRSLITRLYEARRLIEAHAQYEEIREFAKDGLNVAGVDLVALYSRSAEDEKSEVERLYTDSRHRTVHYPKVGSRELRGLLFDYHKFPARLVPENTPGSPAIDTQWVTVVRAQDSWGAPPWSPTISETTAAVKRIPRAPRARTRRQVHHNAASCEPGTEI